MTGDQPWPMMGPRWSLERGEGAEIKLIMLRFCNSRDQNTLWQERRGYKNSFPPTLEYHASCPAVMMSPLSCLLSCCNFHIIHFAPALSPGRWGSHKQMIFTILSCSAYLNSLYNFQVGWHLISRPNLNSQHIITILQKPKEQTSNNVYSGVALTTGDIKGFIRADCSGSRHWIDCPSRSRLLGWETDGGELWES